MKPAPLPLADATAVGVPPPSLLPWRKAWPAFVSVAPPE
jgi:hypothetical protein